MPRLAFVALAQRLNSVKERGSNGALRSQLSTMCRAVPVREGGSTLHQTSNIEYQTSPHPILPIFLHFHSAPGIRQRAEIRSQLQRGKIKNGAMGCRHNWTENYELIY